jgi:ABC-2 type transport system ATP-binding protein
MSESPLALNAQGLVKSFGSITAVGGVDLTLKEGQCLALLGPNGAGKTTTVEMLDGLQSPDKGEVQIFGLSLKKDRKKILQLVGVLLQETNLYKRYSVEETLQLFASFYSNSADVNEVIKRMQLEDKRKAKLKTLSGGQKQRVYIGCAIINNPKLLFLDEPTTGLDPQARHMIWDLLKEIKANGCSILLTTHNMEEAEILADDVAIIDHGKVIASGSPKELIAQTCSEELGEINEIITKVKDAGLSLDKLNIRNITLEDVFLKLTGRSMRDA